MTESADKPTRPARVSWNILIVAAGLTVCVGLLSFLVYQFVTRAPGEIAKNTGAGVVVTVDRAYEFGKKVARDIDRVLHFTPQVRVGQTVVVEKTSPALELVTIRRQFQHRYHWTNIWLRSTKVIQFDGEFVAKAGFDLKEQFALRVDEKDLGVSVVFPEPKVLSVELESFKTADDSGWWNRVSKEDKERVANLAIKAARAELERSNMLEQAKAMLEQQLRGIIEQNGGRISYFGPSLAPLEKP